MKIALISDIHGNVAALEAVTDHVTTWQPDITIVNGDVVNRGPNSAPCWEFVQQRQREDGWLLTRGNHEDFVLAYREPTAENDPHTFGIHRHAWWTRHQLTNAQLDGMVALPDLLTLAAPDSSEVRITHASMGNNRNGILLETPAETVRAQIGEPPPLFLTSHIHWPMVRQLEQTLIVRSGSVGSPRDGDVRASYAQLSWHISNGENGRWHPEIIRVPYDRSRTDQDYHTLGYLADGGPIAELIYHEWRTALPVLAPWQRQYQAAVMAGEVGVETAVSDYLAATGFRDK